MRDEGLFNMLAVYALKIKGAGDYASDTRCEVTGSPKNVRAKRLNRAEASVVKKVRSRLRESFCSIS